MFSILEFLVVFLGWSRSERLRVVVCQVDKSRGTMVADATETDATMAQVTILEPASSKEFYGVSMY